MKTGYRGKPIPAHEIVSHIRLHPLPTRLLRVWLRSKWSRLEWRLDNKNNRQEVNYE